MNLIEKALYVKGLADGLKIDSETAEGKLLLALVEIVEDMAREFEEVKEVVTQIDDDIDDLVDGVVALEDEVYGPEDEDGEHCHCGCEDDMYEITCPNCENKLEVDFDTIAAGEIVCPNCGENLEFLNGGETEE